MSEVECINDASAKNEGACSMLDSNLDRQAIKEARKERNKLKKIQKRQEKEKQQALKIYEQSLDRSVTIITRDFAEKLLISNSSVTLHHSSNSFSASDQDFPSLEAQKNKIVKKSSNSNNTVIPSTCVEKTIIQVQLSEIIDLQTKSSVKSEKPSTHKADIPKYAGNSLDSSRPERKRGKHKEAVRKKQTSLKKNILMNKESVDLNSVSYKTYADHLITQELNDEITNFLRTIVRFQENLFKRDPIRGQSKRRYVVGFHEVKKNLLLNKVKLLIFAPDIKVIEDGVLDSTIKELIANSKKLGIPYVFALKRRPLSKLLKIPVPVSCVGINNYSSLEREFEKIVQIVEGAKTEQDSEVQDPTQKLDPCSQVILQKLTERMKNDG